MNREEIKVDLKKYMSDINSLNRQLDQLAAQKENLLDVGRRIEGIVAYLRAKLGGDDFETMKSEIDKELAEEAAAAVAAAQAAKAAPLPALS